MITVPRWLLLVLATLFSTYHIVLGVYSLDVPRSPWPTVVGLALYTVATVASLWPVTRLRMPDWLAAFDLAVSIVLPLLVTSQLDADAENGYAWWRGSAWSPSPFRPWSGPGRSHSGPSASSAASCGSRSRTC
jgi:hypothetical protein